LSTEVKLVKAERKRQTTKGPLVGNSIARRARDQNPKKKEKEWETGH